MPLVSALRGVITKMKKSKAMTCIYGNCPISHSDDYQEIKPIPVPADEEVNDPLFTAIFDVVYTWKSIQIPEYYTGWRNGDGAHAKLIYDTWKPLLDQYRKMKDDYNKAKEMLDECRGQLEYLHNKFSKTGTTESVLSRLSTLQDSLNKDQLR